MHFVDLPQINIDLQLCGAYLYRRSSAEIYNHYSEEATPWHFVI